MKDGLASKTKLERFANYLSSKGRYRLIPRINPETGQSEKYLERFYILSTKWLGIYLHRFWADDPDGWHTHPWSSISIYLKGRYLEHFPGENIKLRESSGWANFFCTSSFFVLLITILSILISNYWLLLLLIPIFLWHIKQYKLIYYRSAYEAHRITLANRDKQGSVWTLFIRFKRQNKLWGFFPKFIPAKKQSRRDE